MKEARERTAFVIHSLGVGGSEKFFLALVNGFQRAGCSPFVILLENENPLLSELDEGVERVILLRRFRYDLSVSARIRKLIEQKGIRKVFCVEPYSYFLSQLGFLFRNRPKFFLSLHNSIPTGLKKYLLETAYLRFFRRSDKAVFICNYQRLYFARKYFFRPVESAVVYNGIDTDHFSPCRARKLPADLHRWRERLGISPEERVLITVGRISPEKGHAYAVNAMAHLHQAGQKDVHLVIVGGGDRQLEGKLRSMARERELQNYVHFEGGQREVRHYLLHADAFVLSSVSETFSLAALEAMSMGLPVSLTRIGGAEEMVERETGVLCTAADAYSMAGAWRDLLGRLWERQALRLRTEQQFSLQRMVDDYLGLINNDQG